MYIILTVLCLIKIRIIYAFAVEEETRYYFGQNKANQQLGTRTHIKKPHTCEYHRYSTHFREGPYPKTWSEDSKCYVIYQSYNKYDIGCLLTDAGEQAVIMCPSDTFVIIYNVMYNYSRCQHYQMYYSERHYKKNCMQNSFECHIPTTPVGYQKKASIYFRCGVGKPIDDRTTKYYGGIPADDKSTKSHVVKPVDARSTKYHVVKPADVRTTESYVDNIIPGQDTHMESLGIPNSAFIGGGIIGVLIIICIIVGVILLRKRDALRTNKKKGTTQLNPSCDITDRQSEPENYEQAYFMNSPAALNLATSHEANLDKTDGNLRSHGVSICQPQERSILVNDRVLKEDTTTYSHLRNTMDDADVMYDHTVHIAVHDTCDGDYGVAHRRITEDDYDLSGTYHQSLGNNADPVYN